MALFSAALPDYVYTPLQPGARVFRAIRLLPTKRHWPFFSKETLRLEIEEVELDVNTDYECLSYTWGVADGEKPACRVVVEGPEGPRQIFIHRPLETALLELVRSGTVEHLPLFVDQICLNQEDDVEKASQVPLMQDIYSQSARTVAWLGEGTRASNQYFDFLRDLNAEGILSRLMGPNRGHFMQVYDAVMNRDIQTSGVIREDVEDLQWLLEKHGPRFPPEAMRDVYERQWFARLWIVQEACLPRNVTMVCGDRSLCFDCFRSGGLFLNTLPSYRRRNGETTVSRSSIKLLWRLMEMSQGFIRIYQERRAIHSVGARQSAFDVVTRYNVTDGGPEVNASRAEDRIYALMGLMKADDATMGALTVRYDNIASVYTEFAALQSRQNIDVLCYAQFPKKIEGLPSWVPDWSMKLAVARGYTKLKEPCFSAGLSDQHRTIPAAPAIDPASGALVVHGVVVDAIGKVGCRQILRGKEGLLLDQFDHISAKLFYDEIDDFLREASAVPDSSFVRYHSDDEERKADAEIRLSDYGLSERYLKDRLDPEAIRTGLRATKAQIYATGTQQLNTKQQVESYHLNRIFKTVGIVPWYWIPGGDTDICQAMALDPISTSISWIKGTAGFLMDVLGMSLASFITVGYSHFLRFKTKFLKRQVVFPSEQQLRGLGLNANIDHTEAYSALNDFLLKIEERRLYLTKGGFVGLAPLTAAVGDVVVVLYGSTVPHVLRPLRRGDDGVDQWTYVGEAYCDGIMDGELLKDEDRSEPSSFSIF